MGGELTCRCRQRVVARQMEEGGMRRIGWSCAGRDVGENDVWDVGDNPSDDEGAVRERLALVEKRRPIVLHLAREGIPNF